MGEMQDVDLMWAWNNILSAVDLPGEDADRKLNAARARLQRLVSVPALQSSFSEGYLPARIALGSWGIIKSVVSGKDVSIESLEVQRQSMATLLDEITEGSYSLDRRRPDVADMAGCALFLGLLARQGNPRNYAFPSHPSTHYRGYVDESTGLTMHHVTVVNSYGLRPVFLSRLREWEGYQPERVWKIRIGQVLFDAARHYPAIRYATRNSVGYTNGLRAVIDYSIRYLVEEDPPAERTQTTEEDLWLNRAAALAIAATES